MGVSDAWRTNLIFMQKPNRTLLIKNRITFSFLTGRIVGLMMILSMVSKEQAD